MKSFKIIFIVFAVLISNLSCSKDDDNPETTVEELISSGKWYAESQTDTTLNDCTRNGNFRFLNNGNFIVEQ